MSSIGAHHPTAVYTAEAWGPLITVLYLLGLSMLCAMIFKRFPQWSHWRDMTGPKLAILLVLLDSYIFVFIAAMMTLGVGTSRNKTSCSFGIWVCITFYAATKLFITFFLVERIHIVHGQGTKRLKSKLYISNMALMSLWIVVLIVFLSVPNSAHIRDSDDSCVYHLNHSTTFSAAALDLFLDAYFSLLFAVPLWRGKWSNPRIRWIAIKSLLAAIFSMACSVSNLFVIAFLHGKELSWVCLAACTMDTLANASILFYITKTGAQRTSLPPVVNRTAPSFLRSAGGVSGEERAWPSTILRRDQLPPTMSPEPFSNFQNPNVKQSQMLERFNGMGVPSALSEGESYIEMEEQDEERTSSTTLEDMRGDELDSKDGGSRRVHHRPSVEFVEGDAKTEAYRLEIKRRTDDSRPPPR